MLQIAPSCLELRPEVEPVSWRISMVTETYPPEINGVAMTTARLVEGWRRRGHSLQLVRPRQAGDARRVFDTDELLTVPGVRIPAYPQLQAGLPARRRLLALWRLRRPNLVHIVTEGPLGWSALGAARKLGVPVVAGFHTNFHRYSRYYRLGMLQPLAFGYLRHFHNRCAVPSDSEQALSFRREFGVFPGRNHLCATGVRTTGEANMTEVITATYGSMGRAENTVDELISNGIESEKIYLDDSTLQVKVMVSNSIKSEVMAILQRHNPSQVTERPVT